MVYGRFRKEYRGRDLPLHPVIDVDKNGVEKIRLDGKGRESLMVSDWSPYTCQDLAYGPYGGIPQTMNGLVHAGFVAKATDTELPRSMSLFLVKNSKGARCRNVYEVASGAASGAARGPASGSCGGVVSAGVSAGVGVDTGGKKKSCVPAWAVEMYQAQCPGEERVSDSEGDH